VNKNKVFCIFYAHQIFMYVSFKELFIYAIIEFFISKNF